MVGGAVSNLATSQIERYDATLLMGDGELRERERDIRREIAQPADDDASNGPALSLCAGQTLERRINGFVEREAVTNVEDRSVAHLDVAHAILRRVHRELVGNALQRLRRLHHGE